MSADATGCDALADGFAVATAPRSGAAAEALRDTAGAEARPAVTGALAGSSVPVPAGAVTARVDGRAGFLPASGAFGSQLRLRSASAAASVCGRTGTLLTNGFGALVT